MPLAAGGRHVGMMQVEAAGVRRVARWQMQEKSTEKITLLVIAHLVRNSQLSQTKLESI
jgi:hypothetical protein